MISATFVSPVAALQPDEITVLAYGALLSESSSRLTFPDLEEFRHVRIQGFRRVFAHPHLFLLQQNLVDGKRLASLSAEPDAQSSFVAAAFRVRLTEEQRQAFVEREKGYDILSVPYYNMTEDWSSSSSPSSSSLPPPLGMGVLCVRSTDDQYPDLVAQLPPTLLYRSIWSWPLESGLLPADIYLRHCLLAVEKAGLKESFCQDTYLADRTTTLAEYLKDPIVYEQVMNSRPPPALATSFGG